jgi:RNA repair pathway DNA polymerase beta family protein
MRKIVTIKFGSHLYGTSTQSSDIDIKSVFIPDARSIALQRVKGSVSSKRPKQVGEKNYAGEIDEESYSLQRFLELAAEGQTVALDVLFAPEWAMTQPPAPEWQAIMQNRSRLLTRKSAAFVGYCRQQANKYGIKGSRVADARVALAVLGRYIEKSGTQAKLSFHADDIAKQVEGKEHMSIVTIGDIEYWEICGRKLPYTASLKTAHDIVKRLVDEYGHRALQAESQQGVDWKALSHAVRVATQALELLSTANITFPLPNAEHILAIKMGALPYQAVAAEIEELLVRVEEAAAKSSLPESADREWIDDFVYQVHQKEVGGGATI